MWFIDTISLPSVSKKFDARLPAEDDSAQGGIKDLDGVKNRRILATPLEGGAHLQDAAHVSGSYGVRRQRLYVAGLAVTELIGGLGLD